MGFDSLASPITLRGLTLKNRVVLPAMGTKFRQGHEVTDQLLAFHAARAKGGCGLNIVEVCSVHAPSAPNKFLSIATDEMVPELKKVVDVIHENGGKAALQLWQGSIAVASDPTAQIIVASDMPLSPEYTAPGATIELIDELVESYGQAARRSVEAGFDTMEVHMGHNYILHSFLSGGLNHRQDEYGGSFENRAKFPLRVLEEVRKNMPEDMPLFIRIDAHDDYLEGGLTIEEVIAFCKLAKEKGVDVVDVSRGNIISAGLKYEVPPVDLPRAFNIENAARIKKETGMMVMGVGRINTAELADQLLKEGKIDLVGIGRGQLADPEFVNKALEGESANILRCVGCNQGCYDACESPLIPHITCLQNPVVGRELDYVAKPSKEKKKVLIAGGGIGGLEAARILCERGHDVVLVEKTSELGGQFATAGMAPRKHEMKEAMDARAKQVLSQNIDVRLSTEISEDVIKEVKPDLIINAIGASPIHMNLPGFDTHTILDSHDVLNGDVQASGRTLVIGGGLVGLEVAEYVYAKGVQDITIVEMREAMGIDLGSTRKICVMESLYADGVKMMNDAKFLGVEHNVVKVETAEGIQEIPVDTIIQAVGAKRNEIPEVERVIQELGIPYYVIGDAKQPRRAIDATAEAAEIAFGL